MGEIVIMRFRGGPFDSVDLQANTWPPPARFDVKDDDADGHYELRTQSLLPPGMKNVLRGAIYEWVREDG